ncbi:hypothetical protein D4R86_04230 [bacterium]|nr:MAG: hypothetical protein D4R86_04230 [bacterium]
MKQKPKKHHFKIVESYLHHEAVKILRRWVKGKREVRFDVDGYPVFVADIATYTDGIIQRIYEVTYKHPVDGKKLGRIQYWCYLNMTPLMVFEIDAEYILKQIKKPDSIDYINCFDIDFTPF